MKQINNGFAAFYYLTEEGQVYNEQSKKYLKADNAHSFNLKTEEGKYKKINLKNLYKLVYNKNYCIDTIENLPGEQWKYIDNCNNDYMCSSEGRIKSLKGYQAILLKQNIIKGYSRVDLMTEEGRCSKLVSRIIAASFLVQPKNIFEYQIHHKNGNSLDNRADNLQWVTLKEHRELHKELKKQKEKQENGLCVKS